MKIVFIFPQWTEAFGIFSKLAKKTSGFPPLNITYLAAIAENLGHQVEIIDGEIEQLENKDIIKRLKEFSPNFIGITSTTPMFHKTLKLAEDIKIEMDVPVGIGGPHVTLFKSETFDKVFDFLFIGETENTFPKFLNTFEKKGDYSKIQGLVYRHNHESKYTGPVEKTNDLDKIPFPARHLLKQDRYQLGTLKGTLNYTSIMTTRGCPFDCIYCSNSVYGKSVRRRSIENVLDEIEYTVNTYKITHFYFIDDVLTLSKKYSLSLCDGLEKRGLDITYEGSTRANLFCDEELVSKMSATGLIRISFGLESADEEILDIIKKGVPLNSYIVANKLSNKYGIETINSVMLGLPGENKEKIAKTIKFLRKSKDIQHATYSIAMPYPGTEFYEMAKNGQHGLKLHTDDFSKYQRYDSAVLSVGELSPEDIKHLQKKGLLQIYSTPWRFWPMVKRVKLIPIILPALSSLYEIMSTFFKKKMSYCG